MIARSALRRLATSSKSLRNSVLAPTVNLSKIQVSQQMVQSQICLSTSSILRCEATNDINKQIDGMVKEADVVVFMKGVPAAPRCGFSNAVCQIFRMHDVPFEAHDVLQDETLRQGMEMTSALQLCLKNDMNFNF